MNFLNSDFVIKKRMGVNVHGMEKYFKLIESNDSNISLPRGFSSSLINFLNEKEIKFTLDDQRIEGEPVAFENNCKLFDYQREAIKSMLLSENGILVAPPGSGKTMMGIDLIAKLKQPALILVHKKQIFNQWLERIESFLNIPFKVGIDNFQVLSKIIIFDSNRNKQIVDDIVTEVNNNSKCLVLSERKDHLEVLNYYLKRKNSNSFSV